MSPVFAVIDAPIIAGIVVVALILFGAERLPKLARSMGQAKKEFEAASAGKAAPPESSVVEPPVTPPSAPTAPPTTPPSAPTAPPTMPPPSTPQ
jgi:TatA/E family protein of Tat protein translocase